MERLTVKREDGTYAVDATSIEALPNGSFGGEAIARLAAYETALEQVEAQKAAAVARLEEYKAKGKLRSASAQQLLAQKLTYSTMLRLMNVED